MKITTTSRATDWQFVIKGQQDRRRLAQYSPEGKPEPIYPIYSDKDTLWGGKPKIVIDEQVLRARLWEALDKRYGDIDQDWFDETIEGLKKLNKGE